MSMTDQYQSALSSLAGGMSQGGGGGGQSQDVTCPLCQGTGVISPDLMAQLSQAAGGGGSGGGGGAMLPPQLASRSPMQQGPYSGM